MAASGGVKAAIGRDQNLYIGEDRTINVDVNQSDGTPQPMTGWALTWELTDRAGGTVLLTKTVGSGITIGNGDGTDDRAAITLADGDTEGLTDGAGIYYYYLRRTDGDSEVNMAFGPVHLLKASI